MKRGNKVYVLTSWFIKAAVLDAALDLHGTGSPAPRTKAATQNFTFYIYIYIMHYIHSELPFPSLYASEKAIILN